MATQDIYTLNYNVEYEKMKLIEITDDEDFINQKNNLIVIYKLVYNYLQNTDNDNMLNKLKLIIKKNGDPVFTDQTKDEYNVLLSIISYKFLIILLMSTNNDNRYDPILNYFNDLEKNEIFYKLINLNYFVKLNIINDLEVKDEVNQLLMYLMQITSTNVDNQIQIVTELTQETEDRLLPKTKAEFKNPPLNDSLHTSPAAVPTQETPAAQPVAAETTSAAAGNDDAVDAICKEVNTSQQLDVLTSPKNTSNV
jgi:hypothetical protein